MSRSCAPARQRLAEGPFCTVDTCSCGTLHVSIGAITLRLAPEVASSILHTLRTALANGGEARSEELPVLHEWLQRARGRSLS